MSKSDDLVVGLDRVNDRRVRQTASRDRAVPLLPIIRCVTEHETWKPELDYGGRENHYA